MNRRKRGEEGAEISLPITPMLDMSFQLLFFFMATFNPTEPEGAQALAVAKDTAKQPTETNTAKSQAKDPEKIKPDQGHALPKNDEPIALDTDLRLLIKKEAQGEYPIAFFEGPTRPPKPFVEVSELYTIKKVDGRDKKVFNKDLRDMLAAKLEERKKKAEESARSNSKLSYDEALKLEQAKLKVRIQTQVDTPWGDVFDAMNLCKEVGYPAVALSTPLDWVPKIEPQP